MSPVRDVVERSVKLRCIDGGVYRVSLVVGREYESLPDSDATKHGQVRVIDESGEDYLYPRSMFVPA
jgi:hypothetical protein